MTAVQVSGKVWDWIGQQAGISSVVRDESPEGCLVMTPHGQTRAANIAYETRASKDNVETTIRKWEAIVAYSQAEGRNGVESVANMGDDIHVIHFVGKISAFSSDIATDLNESAVFAPPVEALEVAFVMSILHRTM